MYLWLLPWPLKLTYSKVDIFKLFFYTFRFSVKVPMCVNVHWYYESFRHHYHYLIVRNWKNCGFRGHFNRLIQSYLNKWQQYVCSLLRPLLFLIFVKDLPTNMKKSEITLFAKNTSIVCKGEEEAISWFNEKKLCAYSKKISIGVFS